MALKQQFLVEARFKPPSSETVDLFPFNLPFLRGLDVIAFHPRVTYFVGENGTGKSTLLEAVARTCGFNGEGGSKNFNFSTAPEDQSLARAIKLIRGVRSPKDGYFYRADSFYNVISEIDRLDPHRIDIANSYGDRSLHTRSHGEGFFDLVSNRLRGNGLYLFDEPESGLSPTRQLSLLSAIDSLVKRGSQFIIATHSPIVLSYPEASIFSFQADSLVPVTYQDTELVQMTDMFFKRRAHLLEQLFG